MNCVVVVGWTTVVTLVSIPTFTPAYPGLHVASPYQVVTDVTQPQVAFFVLSTGDTSLAFFMSLWSISWLCPACAEATPRTAARAASTEARFMVLILSCFPGK